MPVPASSLYPQIRPRPQLPKTLPPWRNLTIIWLAQTSPLESTPLPGIHTARSSTQRDGVARFQPGYTPHPARLTGVSRWLDPIRSDEEGLGAQAALIESDLVQVQLLISSSE